MHNHLVTTKEDLNPILIARQELKEEDLDKIVELHGELHQVFDEMEAETPENVTRLRQLAIVVKQLEFDLQDAWGFPKDEDWHSWWFQVPHCRCPNLDNWDLIGTKLRITTQICPVHGETNE